MVRAACHIRPKCCIRTRQNATLIPVVAWHVIEGFDVRSLRTCAQTDRLSIHESRERLGHRRQNVRVCECPWQASRALTCVRAGVGPWWPDGGGALRSQPCTLAAVHPEGSYLASYRGTRRPQGLAQSCTASRRTGARPRRGLLVRPGRTKS